MATEDQLYGRRGKSVYMACGAGNVLGGAEFIKQRRGPEDEGCD
jgi:hypothetical protein